MAHTEDIAGGGSQWHPDLEITPKRKLLEIFGSAESYESCLYGKGKTILINCSCV
jgi:hypothetical protein